MAPRMDYKALTCKNAANSPLLKIPGEIRNRIYNYLFSGWRADVNLHTDAQQTVLSCFAQIIDHQQGDVVRQPQHIVKIRTVCHLIHKETHDIIRMMLLEAVESFWEVLERRLAELQHNGGRSTFRELQLNAPPGKPPGFIIDTYAALRELLPHLEKWHKLDTVVVVGKETRTWMIRRGRRHMKLLEESEGRFAFVRMDVVWDYPLEGSTWVAGEEKGRLFR